MHPERKNVLRVGSIPIEQAEYKSFNERALTLTPINLNEISAAAANSAGGIVIVEPPHRIGSIRSWIEAFKDVALDFDLAIATLVHPPTEQRIVEGLFQELKIGDRSSCVESFGYAAQFIYDWNPGPPASDLKILTSGFKVPATMELLLKRAFGDCDQIYLEPLTGGRDSTSVFCVHALLKKSPIDLPRPLPFFIKISAPDKIAPEYQNYTRYANFYIPFYLRPNVVPPRCIRIAGMSSIVGNFVEDSSPLRQVLKSSQCGIIYSLFETSLKGFRFGTPGDSKIKSLGEFIKTRTRATEVESRIIETAREHFRFNSSPLDIESRLIGITKDVKRPFRAYHGDLHTGNVRVRGKDAILIDFSAIEDGPLTADPATLEVSLVFGTDEADKLAELDEWKSAVDEIYSGRSFHEPPSLGTDFGPFAWLYKAVREIRHVLLGCDCRQEEAAAILAAFLLRFARLPTDTFKDGSLSQLALSRQSYALVIADRIAAKLEATHIKTGIS